MATAITLISSATVSSNVADITFSSIPQTYTDLYVIFSIRDSSSGGAMNNLYFTVNGSGADIDTHAVIGTGTSSLGVDSGSSVAIYQYSPTSLATANTFSNGSIYLANYTGSTIKSFSIDNVAENNAAGANMAIVAGVYAQTTAITSVKLFPSGADLVQYSTVYLYGISNA